MDEFYGRRGGFLSFAVSILLGVVALYLAVQIIASIWLWLCGGALVVAGLMGLVWWLRRARSPW